jgi:hypothetical protein
MFASIEILFVLKYNRYHTNEILGFNSFEYFFFFFFCDLPELFSTFFESIENIE